MSPRELEAVAVAVDAVQELVRGYDDVRALVLALAEHMPPEGVAELLARLIEAHPEGAGMVRLSRDGREGRLILLDIRGLQRGRTGHTRGRWTVRTGLVMDPTSSPPSIHPTREAAEAALIAAQPVPTAVVRVRP